MGLNKDGMVRASSCPPVGFRTRSNGMLYLNEIRTCCVRRESMDFELSDEHQFIRQTVRDFVEKELAPRAKQIDATGEFPHDVFKQMGALGFLGLPFPEKYGGADGDTLSVAL